MPSPGNTQNDRLGTQRDDSGEVVQMGIGTGETEGNASTTESNDVEPDDASEMSIDVADVERDAVRQQRDNGMRRRVSFSNRVLILDPNGSPILQEASLADMAASSIPRDPVQGFRARRQQQQSDVHRHNSIWDYVDIPHRPRHAERPGYVERRVTAFNNAATASNNDTATASNNAATATRVVIEISDNESTGSNTNNEVDDVVELLNDVKTEPEDALLKADVDEEMADMTGGGGTRSVQPDIEGMGERSTRELLAEQSNKIRMLEASMNAFMEEMRRRLGDSQ